MKRAFKFLVFLIVSFMMIGTVQAKTINGFYGKIDDDVTVIKTRFKSGNQEGTLAIIGPKRMEYDRVVSMLEYMKENIER